MNRPLIFLLAGFILTGCAEETPVVSSVTPFISHVSRSNAEIIARYKVAREAGLSDGSAFAYAKGDHTYSAHQLDVLALNELYYEPQRV